MSTFNIKQSFILYKHLAIFTRLCLFVNTHCVYSTQLRGSFYSRMLRQISHLLINRRFVKCHPCKCEVGYIASLRVASCESASCESASCEYFDRSFHSKKCSLFTFSNFSNFGWKMTSSFWRQYFV